MELPTLIVQSAFPYLSWQNQWTNYKVLLLHHMFKKKENKKAKYNVILPSERFAYWKNQTSSFYFKKLNNVHHGTAYNQGHVRNPHCFTDQKRLPLFQLENFIRGNHVYMKVWRRVLGECLVKEKQVSELTRTQSLWYACGREEVVGHVPHNISKVVPSAS